MVDKKIDGEVDQYRGFIKLLAKILGPILLLVLLYLAYAPPPKYLEEYSFELSIGDILVFIGLGLFAIAILIQSNGIKPRVLCQGLKSFRKSLCEHPYKYWIWFLVILAIAIIFTAFKYFHIEFNLDLIFARLSSADEILNMRNLTIGLVGIISLVLAGRRAVAMERQTEVMEKRREQDRQELQITEARRLDERFIEAVKLLSQKLDEINYPSHLGAIISLRDLAIDDEKYTQRCIDVICSCNQWMEEYLEIFSTKNPYVPYSKYQFIEDGRVSDKTKKDGITIHHERRSQSALMAITSILINLGNNSSLKHLLSQLNFQGKMLCGINLYGAEIAGINFIKAYLNGANLSRVNMQGSALIWANLQGANLHKAGLQGANLSYANIRGANLCSAQMQGANLQSANLLGSGLIFASLQGADLTETNLRGSILLGANLYGSIISDTNFTGVLFDEISDKYHIQDAPQREIFINDICDEIYDSNEREKFVRRMTNAWEETDENIISPALSNSCKNYFIESTDNSDLSIKGSQINLLANHYSDILSEINTELELSIIEVMDFIIPRVESYFSIKDEYPKIKSELREIWQQIKQKITREELEDELKLIEMEEKAKANE